MIGSIGSSMVWIDRVDSTNRYARAIASGDHTHGMVIATHHQTEGKGQKGNDWESAPGQNLTLSIILHPQGLGVQSQFMLSKAIALALHDTLAPRVSGVAIKWPNDIYVRDRKVAGVLVETTLLHSQVQTAVVGIGLNVNQTRFPADVPNPTSLHLELGHPQGLTEWLDALCVGLNRRYQQLCRLEWDALNREYLALLYRRSGMHWYNAQGRAFLARIVDVRASGELVLETSQGERVGYIFQEVSFAQ